MRLLLYIPYLLEVIIFGSLNHVIKLIKYPLLVIICFTQYLITLKVKKYIAYETIITVEMNNNSSIEVLHRNNRQFSAMVKKSKNYDKYRQSILINFNNFAFLGKDETYYINYIKDEEGIVLTDAIMIINIYIPNLLKNAII